MVSLIHSVSFVIQIALHHYFYAHEVKFGLSLACSITNTSFCLGVQDLPQYEATKAYMPKALDELSLQQAELVIVLQEVEGKRGSFHCTILKWRDLKYCNQCHFTAIHIPSPMAFFWFSFKLLWIRVY